MVEESFFGFYIRLKITMIIKMIAGQIGEYPTSKADSGNPVDGAPS